VGYASATLHLFVLADTKWICVFPSLSETDAYPVLTRLEIHLIMGFQPFYGQGPHPILWAGSRAARGKITVSGMRNFIIYCNIFILHTQFTNVTAGLKIQSGRPRVRDPCCREFRM